MEGHCNCKAIHVRVVDADLFTKRRGHLGATNLVIEADKVTITGAENLSLYKDGESLTGNVVKRYFCKTCGNPIKSETQAASDAGKVILKLGIFDKIPNPEFESFAKDRQHWGKPLDGVTAFKVAVGGEKEGE